ncbi:hypothetical protein DFH09DRAFT_994695 [Mycena vulgaris]|nr:hypothetical protein DFH09DRAFT_994695 [Mycena vulgaris]
MVPAGCPNCTLLSVPEVSLETSTISSDILESNDPPAEVNIPSIREFLGRGRPRRAQLDAKIAVLRASLDELLEERNPLDTEIRKHEGAVSPLRRLPAELLSLIFKFTLPPYSPEEISGPWIVGGVCRRWRTVALSHPTLWSTIVLDFSEAEPTSETHAALEVQLERSRGCPLNITFIPWDDLRCRPMELKIVNILASHCERWEVVMMVGPEALYSRLAGIRGYLPLLRVLNITIRPNLIESEEDSSPRPMDMFEFCPRLREAYIDMDVYLEATAPTVELPYSQLLRFTGRSPWPHYLSALSSASNLVDCILNYIEPTPIPSGTTITLPHLRRLSLSTTTVLDFLKTPALQELYCCDQSGHLHSFLRRLHNLHKLVVPETPSAADITRLLHAAPTITTLGIYLPIGFTRELFSVLALPMQNASALAIPALEAISIRVTSERSADVLDVLHLDQDLLMQTVEAQWQHGTWRSVKLYCPKFTPSPDTLARMELLRSQGMQIVIFLDSVLLYDDLVPLGLRLYTDWSWFFED